MRQSVSGDRYGDTANHPRNLVANFCKVGMGVVPKTFLCHITYCFCRRMKIELLKISITYRDGNIRIISVRRARDEEVELYEN